MITTNLAVRFALELSVLAAAAAWTWRIMPAGWPRISAAIAVVIALGTIWATVVHGASVPAAAQLGTQIVIFAAATLAIAEVWRPVPAAAFAAVALVNAVLLAATAA
jgi:Protein of unknown function (DUF2568)